MRPVILEKKRLVFPFTIFFHVNCCAFHENAIQSQTFADSFWFEFSFFHNNLKERKLNSILSKFHFLLLPFSIKFLYKIHRNYACVHFILCLLIHYVLFASTLFHIYFYTILYVQHHSIHHLVSFRIRFVRKGIFRLYFDRHFCVSFHCQNGAEVTVLVKCIKNINKIEILKKKLQ